MKKWIEFLLIILGVGFITSITLNFIKGKNKEEETIKNYKHTINIKNVCEGNVDEYQMRNADFTFELITSTNDKITSLDDLVELFNDNLKTYTLNNSSFEYFVLDATGTCICHDSQSGLDIKAFNYIKYSDNEAYFEMISELIPDLALSSPYFSFYIENGSVDGETYTLSITDTVEETTNSISVSGNIEDYFLANSND